MPHSEIPAPDIKRSNAPPAVSIVMPAYNVAPYIRETLDSVFAQTFTDYEAIIVNDGSPDTEELERELEPYLHRIVYLKQENRGAAVARNRGVEVARADFVAFLDADDLWLPDYLDEQIKFQRSDDYDLVYADALLFGESPFAGRTFMETAPSSGAVTFQSLISGRCNVITSGVVARRQMILDVGLFDEQLRNSQDFDLWLKLARHGARAAYQRKVLLRYRFHENSLSGDALNRINRELRVLNKYESLPDLTTDDRAVVSQTLSRLRVELELESGKLALARGNFAEARAAFAQANELRHTWKLGAVNVIMRVAPRVLQKIYVRRVKR